MLLSISPSLFPLNHLLVKPEAEAAKDQVFCVGEIKQFWAWMSRFLLKQECVYSIKYALFDGVNRTWKAKNLFPCQNMGLKNTRISSE
jgi:hypothetical protein